MTFIIRSICVLVCICFGISVFAEESRIWTSKANGRQFKGALVKVEGDVVSIRRESDKVVFQVNKNALTPADLEWIQQQAPQPASVPGPIEDLSPLISGIPAADGPPAIGVLLVKDGQTRGRGVSGVRKAGTSEEVESDDKWHLGSCTKSMTATLAATFVEEEALSWETTISQILGKDLKMLEAYQNVTLGQLLANRSGLPKSVPDSVYDSIDYGAGVGKMKSRDMIEQRLQYVEAVLNLAPVFEPNTANGYSNSGFVVAGAMLEKVSGKPWEQLVEERIFKPLGMTNSGFGNAAREDKKKPSQPWPHQNGTTPVEPGTSDDNSWVIGPAGTVHGSLKDVARYLSMHANRELGPVIKNAETYQFLHTAVPQNNNYARGWIVARTGWSGGPAISHDGSNTMNYCSIWVAPETKAAVAAFTNCAEKGRENCDKAIKAVVDKYLR